MPKRKPLPERRVWARMIGPDWQVHLADGEVLLKTRNLSAEDARRLCGTLPTFYLGFGMPVRDLTGDGAAIEAELTADRARSVGPEWNSFAVYRGASGMEAIVIKHHH